MTDPDLINEVVKTLQAEGFKSWDEIPQTYRELWEGVFQGWWEWVDSKRKMPIPFPVIVNIHDKDNRYTMAHALVEAKFYESVSKARKDGWNKPAVCGDHYLFKRTERLLIINVGDDND